LSPPPSSAPDRPADQGHPSGPRLFARNRRDGARLLSSGLIITVIGLVGWSHPLGRIVAMVAGAVSLYWWLQYRQLSQ
jgi:hypothetical protein